MTVQTGTASGAHISAERADAIEQVAGALAHDFSNVLTALVGHLDLLLDRFPQPSPERQLLLEVRAGSEVAGRLTRQLQAISGRQSMRAEPTDLNEVVQDQLDVLQQIAGADIEVRLDLGGQLPLINLDGRLLAQLLRALVAASRDALPKTGRITVRTLVVPDLLGPGVLLEVHDTRDGKGIRELGDRVFEPRLISGRHVRGAGLVLAAVRGIVRQSGGTVSMEEAPGGGVSVVMRFSAVESL